MRIEIDDVLRIDNIGQYQFELDWDDVALAQSVRLEDGKIQRTRVLTDAYLENLKQRDVQFLNLIIPQKLMKELREKYPDIFPPPSAKATYAELKKLQEQFAFMNEHSDRQRRIFLDSDIVLLRGGKTEYEIIADYKDEVDSKMIAHLDKENIKHDKIIGYHVNESGVLLFLPNEEDIKLRIDLVAVLSMLDLEVYDARDLETAYQYYHDTLPRMVILGNLATDARAKEFYLYLNRHDPFCRLLNYDKSPSGNREEEAEKIRVAYEQSYDRLVKQWHLQKDRKAQMEKQEIPEEMLEKILSRIDMVRRAGSAKGYIELLFLVQQLSSKYNTRDLDIKLKNMEKSLPVFQFTGTGFNS